MPHTFGTPLKILKNCSKHPVHYSFSTNEDSLTRSQSEGSKMHHPDRQSPAKTLRPASPNHSHSESNETLERRNLKSILKRLSEDVIQLPAPAPVMDSTELRRLMRSQTLEGYVARHTKLMKSVTFDRDTLSSPPVSFPPLQAQLSFPVRNTFSHSG